MNIVVYPTFFDTTEMAQLMDYFLKHVQFRDSFVTVTGKPASTRNKALYGDGSVGYYKIRYRGEESFSLVHSWEDLPVLQEMAQYIADNVVKHSITTASFHYYPKGNVGIKPHRDKEMLPDSVIASVSFGVARVMRFSRIGFVDHDLLLLPGALCLIMPPTNDYWLHSIPYTPRCTLPRMSIVFRNYVLDWEEKREKAKKQN